MEMIRVKMKKVILIVLSLIMIFLLSGCDEKKIEVSIESEINGYSPAMSIVPGMPLNAVFKEDIKNENIKYHWTTEQGTFLTWKDGIVNILGKDIVTNEQKVYWTVGPTGEIEESTFNIYLTIEDDNSAKVLGETSIQIEKNKEGLLFSIKK